MHIGEALFTKSLAANPRHAQQQEPTSLANYAPQAIQPLSLAFDALRLLWQKRDDALRLGLVPTLILFGGFVFGWDAISRYWSLLEANEVAEIDSAIMGRIFVVVLVSGVAAALAAANWLRFLLLGPMSAVGLGLALDRSHLGFFASGAALLIALGLALAILSMPIGFLPGPFNLLAMIGLMICLVVVFARQVFVPISIVIGQPMTPIGAWAATRGNGIRLAFALALVEIPVFIALNIVVFILGMFGFAQSAPFAMMFIGAMFQTAIFIAQSGVLANAFRHLIGIEA